MLLLCVEQFEQYGIDGLRRETAPVEVAAEAALAWAPLEALERAQPVARCRKRGRPVLPPCERRIGDRRRNAARQQLTTQEQGAALLRAGRREVGRRPRLVVKVAERSQPCDGLLDRFGGVLGGQRGT